jgi:hypothetical protein
MEEQRWSLYMKTCLGHFSCNSVSTGISPLAMVTRGMTAVSKVKIRESKTNISVQLTCKVAELTNTVCAL